MAVKRQTKTNKQTKNKNNNSNTNNNNKTEFHISAGSAGRWCAHVRGGGGGGTRAVAIRRDRVKEIYTSPDGWGQTSQTDKRARRREKQRYRLAELARATTSFGVSMYRQLTSQTRDNVIFSPLSVFTALSMTLPGTRGSTKAQLRVRAMTETITMMMMMTRRRRRWMVVMVVEVLVVMVMVVMEVEIVVMVVVEELVVVMLAVVIVLVVAVMTMMLMIIYTVTHWGKKATDKTCDFILS